MSTSDLCQALLGQYPSTQKHNFISFTHHKSPFSRVVHVSYRNRTALLTQSCISLNQHPPPPRSLTVFMLHFILHSISANLPLHLCYSLNLKSHLLHQALQSERGWEGGRGEETQSPAPGVTVDGSLQRFPQGGRTCQTVHEGRKSNVPGKKRKLGVNWTSYGRNENGHFLPDFVPLRAGWPLRAPGPGEGREGTADTVPAASQTVSDHIITYT